MILEFPINPKGKQKDFLFSDARYTLLCAGRRFGKTELAKMRAIIKGCESQKKIYWLEPVYRQAKRIFSEIKEQYEPIIKYKHESDLVVELLNDTQIIFRGTDQPEYLRGDYADHVTLDESAYMRHDLYYQVVRPMVATTQGTIDFVTTPNGRNWFYEVWHETGKLYKKIHGVSLENPVFTKDEWEEVKDKTPQDTFRQEYLAEFVDITGSVFRDFSKCIQGDYERPERYSEYVMGVDLAKMNDFTVITVWHENRRHMVYLDRFNELSWVYQKQKIAEVARMYKVNLLIIDATGVGSPIVDDLQQELSCHIVPYVFNSGTKTRLVENLKLQLEKGSITFPDDPEVIKELKLYRAEKGLSTIKYSAPAGYHDDIVMSMGLGALAMIDYTIKHGEI